MALNWKDKVIRNFDQKALLYDQYSDIQKHAALNLSNDMPALNNADILEIGCGTGVLTKHLLQKYPGRNFCITDISPSMLQKAKQNHPGQNINWKIMDGENASIQKPYDLIVAGMSLQWFENIMQGIRTLSQYLKPDGHLFFTVPGPESFREWKQVLEKLHLPSGLLPLQKPPGIYREEHISLSYPDARTFLQTLKNLGAGCAGENYKPLKPAQIKSACEEFDKAHPRQITWQILYGCLSAKDFRMSSRTLRGPAS